MVASFFVGLGPGGLLKESDIPHCRSSYYMFTWFKSWTECASRNKNVANGWSIRQGKLDNIPGRKPR